MGDDDDSLESVLEHLAIVDLAVAQAEKECEQAETCVQRLHNRFNGNADAAVLVVTFFLTGMTFALFSQDTWVPVFYWVSMCVGLSAQMHRSDMYRLWLIAAVALAAACGIRALNQCR
jgi:hypothetical protein